MVETAGQWSGGGFVLVGFEVLRKWHENEAILNQKIMG